MMTDVSVHPHAARTGRHGAERPLIVALALLFFGQRIAIPGLGVPLLAAVPMALAFLFVLRGGAIPRHRLTIAAIISCLLGLSYVGWLFEPRTALSIQSLGVLVLIWAAVIATPAPTTSLPGHVHRWFIRFALATSLVAIGQIVLQLLGLGFIDPLSALPREWLVDGYLTTSPIGTAGTTTGLFRSNAVFFLEPSLASQFFALAAALSFRRSALLPSIFVVAILTTGSGTGVLALAAAILGLVPHLSVRSAVRVLSVIVIGAIALVATGYSERLLGRAAEFSSTGTSAQFRFLDPWLHVAAFLQNPVHLISGYGPGGTAVTKALYGNEVNYSFPTQAIIEYGLLFGVVLTLSIAVLIWRSAQEPEVKLCLLVVTFFLSGALVQPASALLVLVLALPGARPAAPIRKRDPLEADRTRG